MDYRQQVADAVADSINNQISTNDIYGKIEKPKTPENGDLAFPAFILAKELHKAPQMIAQDIVNNIDGSQFDKVVAVGPYVNFFLDKGKVSKQVMSDILTDKEHYGDNYDGKDQTVTIDMSSPNIAKPMSMGHLRSTVIGNSISEILKKNGYKTVKDNHLGDWGTQFGKLITAYLKWGNEDDVKRDPIHYLVQYYVKFHKEDQKDPELDEEAREWFKKLEDGDPEATKLWEWFRDVSLKAFNNTYKTLGVSFDTYNGESFYNDKMDEVVDILKKDGLLQESQGAQVVDLSDDNLNPALILKSDGASLYITRDIATALYRERTYHPVMNLYVVGSEQTNYFHQLKAVLKKMGVENADGVHHIPFGLITVNGKKLSTRRGNIILLNQVLDESIAMAKQQIAEKNPDLPNKDEVAKQVGVGAIIFGDLKSERINSIDFVLEDQLKFEGETGPYVQYAHARSESILRKSGKKELNESANELTDEGAWEVIKLLQAFPEVVKQARNEFEPSDVAKYSLRLAKAFNKYYAHSKILADDDEQDARLDLVKSVAIVLKESLRLLGIEAPDQM
ncbi:arginine--tRNA ligase [Fructilactobacillus fructivorans]|uniref:Arginine--tRNA ligase n=1 Tax=Fructilactobacillus fructivorans TaxID=1614 RepID=A0A0C1PQB1_9LACO|nr:arginine--tRNA ligase [Fructilactobacillus fructivorans]KID42081.1 Arginyl-tRNA synthetase [Fructilactobacillus fructivorans]MCT0151973.1 arginine--tRNA ligase [Fructilactobacillus fructivorans]MCT2867865.1 arginine--tRNA ligase [Fructilactobacillus fructivorans]MCT2868553.1 arginine--tRNA ligase [Fructilactobacillus fructivorans]MCT2873553.1 arginine--tRNA ligase [Fructilactobacillus fructivorans]